MKKEIKVEWCENWIKSLFKKHTIEGKPINGIYTGLFWELAEKSGLWIRGTYGSAMSEAVKKLTDFEMITDSNGSLLYNVFKLKKAV